MIFWILYISYIQVREAEDTIGTILEVPQLEKKEMKSIIFGGPEMQ
uniref:Uncharacterized protein n=1 Tax=Wuchereria bancrofti TaxID=6293 RepID=A0AAF5RTA8_WUCBA